ncbi:endonuclease I family protein [Shouchella shacheensis]|uniref:endonuclease I family protein n=1 Tax=Shouchella shacheensis TaxID=1649580 RepID=UPI0007403A86|nr:endonuclease [Shouchella shacheensis]
MSSTALRQEILLTVTEDRQRLDAILFQLAEVKAQLLQDEKVYYDEEKDQQTIKEYYNAIDVESTQDELFPSLQRLLKETHTTQVRYDPAEYVYPWVDLQPDGTLTSIYSGRNRQPEEVLSKDYETSMKRQIELEKIPDTDTDLLKRKMAQIESDFKYNCEHVVPQSWFNEQEPMRGDLHHLFTCEPVCNSIRSNYPYHDFEEYHPENSRANKITEGCGKAENRLFEPEYAKGNVARAMLYFLLRYPDQLEPSYNEDIDRQVLLDWHRQFPVSLYEKHRNQAIYEIQGNRNPFIDFPKETKDGMISTRQG